MRCLQSDTNVGDSSASCSWCRLLLLFRGSSASSPIQLVCPQSPYHNGHLGICSSKVEHGWSAKCAYPFLGDLDHLPDTHTRLPIQTTIRDRARISLAASLYVCLQNCPFNTRCKQTTLTGWQSSPASTSASEPSLPQEASPSAFWLTSFYSACPSSSCLLRQRL